LLKKFYFYLKIKKKIQAYSSTDGTIHGECSDSDAGSGLGTKISSSLLDFSNKQGVVCFVGQFSDNSIAVACLKNQVCQVNSFIFY